MSRPKPRDYSANKIPVIKMVISVNEPEMVMLSPLQNNGSRKSL